jgi:hypothetical protein
MLQQCTVSARTEPENAIKPRSWRVSHAQRSGKGHRPRSISLHRTNLERKTMVGEARGQLGSGMGAIAPGPTVAAKLIEPVGAWLSLARKPYIVRSRRPRGGSVSPPSGFRIDLLREELAPRSSTQPTRDARSIHRPGQWCESELSVARKEEGRSASTAQAPTIAVPRSSRGRSLGR